MLTDKTTYYDMLKAPFRGHALAELLEARNSPYQFSGSFSFETEAEYRELKFLDSTASEDQQEIDPLTGDPLCQYSYDQVSQNLPTWAEVEAEHVDNMNEYNRLEGKRERTEKYPAYSEQLDMLYKDIDAGHFYIAIKAVKDSSA
jgi:hypothetical protein